MDNIPPLVDRYAHLAKSYLSGSVSYLILYVTSRCNLKCNMCFYADSLNAPTGDGLSLAEMEKVSKSLPNLMQLTMTGGEPFLRKDLNQIIGYFCENSGVRNFTIPTNGTYTEATQRVMSEVLGKYPAATFKVGISLDGTKEMHNTIRGWEGSYDKIVATHAMLWEMQTRYPNLIITLSGVVSSFNVHNVRALVDEFFEKFPADDYTLQLTRGTPKDLAAKDVAADEYEKCIEYLEYRKQEHYKTVNLTRTMVRKLTTRTRRIVSETAKNDSFQVNCVAGSRLVVLYDTGVLTPCEIPGTRDLPPRSQGAQRFRVGTSGTGITMCRRPLTALWDGRCSAYIKDTRCRCTFECAIIASIFYQPAELLKTVTGFGLPDDETIERKVKDGPAPSPSIAPSSAPSAARPASCPAGSGLKAKP